jgi:hypothetical protein
MLDCAAEEDMEPSKKLALMAFADSADKLTRVAFPGLDRVMKWSGRKRSRAMELIAELCDDGKLKRKATGHKGRQAEYWVYPEGCCPLHGPIVTERAPDSKGPAGRNVTRSEEPAPTPPPTPEGSGPSDPSESIGSGKGSGKGSGPDRTPSNLRITTTPQPPASQGAVRCAQNHNRPTRGCCAPRDVRAAQTAPPPLPPWCEQCDDPRSRVVEIDDRTTAPCPRCHPSALGRAS